MIRWIALLLLVFALFWAGIVITMKLALWMLWLCLVFFVAAGVLYAVGGPPYSTE